MVRFLRFTAALLGVVLLLAIAGGGAALWLTLSPQRGKVRIAGLSAPIDVTIDQDGIPRIRAANLQDAGAALGYLHARSRLFEMDLMRRAGSGRLSELAGSATMRLDREARILGERRRAEADLAALPADTRALLEAYARGVNAWIAARGRFAAPEFIPLGAPEPWTPVDSLLWGEMMGMWLSEITRPSWRAPPSRATCRPTASASSGRPTTRPGARMRRATARGAPRCGARRARAGRAAALSRAVHPAGIAPRTNGRWMAATPPPARPLLAGDPHLGLGFPSLWFLARIDTPEGVLAGATAPGVPFLVIGRNSHIAWTFTTTGADTQDVFEETVLPDGTYQTPDGPAPFVAHEEVIKVRGGPDVHFVARETRHGPVISDLDTPPRAEIRGVARPPVLAVQMMNLAPGNTAAAGLLALDRAASVAEAGRAAALITAPVQNLLVADRDGIGMFTTGRVPIRRAGDGSMPVPGAEGALRLGGVCGRRPASPSRRAGERQARERQ